MSVSATLWEHINFGGQSFTSDSANFRYFWNTWGGHNDFFSSMRAWSNGNRGNAYAFEHVNFAGRLAALNVGGGFSSSWWWYFGDDFNDKVSSSLIVVRSPEDRETAVPLRNNVASQFASIFDAKTAGKPVSRDGAPRVYGTFFPGYDSQKVFATIDQNLTVQVRIPIKIPTIFGEVDLGQVRWSDYAANVRMHVLFFISADGKLHGEAWWSHVWVESGVFSQTVHDDLAPTLHAAKADLTAAIESQLALFSRRRFSDVYLLPGPVPDMNQFGFFAQHDDDVTLVAVSA